MSSIFFYEPFYDFERFFDETLNAPQPRLAGGQQLQRRQGEEGAVRAWKPRMDLHEDSDKNLVTATFELPGVSKEDVSLNVQNSRLTITAETKHSSEHDEGGYAVRERRYGKWSRTLQMPSGIKEEEIKASLDDGVLTVTFPKATLEQAPKRINVS